MRCRLRAQAKGKENQTSVWLDEFHPRGQKWLRLGTLAGELPGISRERWGEIGEACGQRVVVFERWGRRNAALEWQAGCLGLRN